MAKLFYDNIMLIETLSSLERKFYIISKRVKQLKSEYNFTQKELADKLHITPKMISFYKLDERTPSDDIKIEMSKIFNVPLDYILDESDIKNPYKKNENILEIYNRIKLVSDASGITIEELEKETNLKPGTI